MRKKIRAALTTRKNRKIPPTVPIVEKNAFLTVSAPLAATTETGPLSQVHRKWTIGVDLMGSDHAPSILLKTLQALDLPSEFALTAIATSDWIDPSFHFVEAKEVIGMDENPLSAVRKKKHSSLCIGMRLLKEQRIDALVSAGNTGALVTAGKAIVGMYPSISRPALAALMPTKKEPICVLDLGANLQAKRSHLVQFARLGVAYQKARGIASPTVGLLNIGEEAAKGTSELRAAYKKLTAAPFRFAGNIEGKSAFDGEVDVLVTDGFTGNIFLKTAEGLANLILERLHSHIPPDMLKKFSDLQKHLHYAEYSGALLAGLKNIAIKCHGYSTPQAFANSVKGAVELLRGSFKETFEQVLLAKEDPF